MTRAFIFSLCVGLSASIAGCDSEGSGSCDASTSTDPQKKQCIEYRASSDFISIYSASCTANKGTWTDGGACPREGALGACQQVVDNPMLTTTAWHYTGGRYSSTAAVVQSCTTGTFIEP
jgi:hypothetical protein